MKAVARIDVMLKPGISDVQGPGRRTFTAGDGMGERVGRPVGKHLELMVEGASIAELTSQVEQGRLEYTPGSSRILIREGSSGARRRFTIAHELAHVLLAESDSQGVFRRSTHSDDAIERLCDSLAAAILMPRNWMSHFSSRPHNLSTVRSVSHHADVSYSAAVARLRSVLRWEEGLLRFEFMTAVKRGATPEQPR